MPGAAGDDHDDLDDDPEPVGNPPHPLDRVWRHPSELPAVDVAPVASRRAGVGRNGHRLPMPVWLALAAGAGALVTLGVLAAFGAFDDREAEAPTSRRLERVRVEDAAVAKLASDIAPSIVTVAVVGPAGAKRGSGVCVRHSGDILTSERLVRDATRLAVVTHEGEVRDVEVRGRDPDTDLALLSVGAGLEAAPVAADLLEPGDTVLAVGANGGNGKPPWIGNGIVASVDTSVAQLGGPAMDGLIATDAHSGLGGVGGALLDRQGAVAGIVLAPIDGDGSTYAVPIRFAAHVAEQLRDRGRAAHGWLGVQGVDTNGLPTVTALTENGPAANAGMQAGDVIVAVGDKVVMTMGEVTAAIRWYAPRTMVVVKVRRGEDIVNLDVTVGSAPLEAQPGA
jgi:putative serine protease PepD